jgi:glycosyltransferase involved in cell wall biosynthesis
MAERKPLVSIGMPIHNEGAYLRLALDSLLGQAYENIELIISDNASRDDTGSICRDYAARDPRIRYVKNETNVGAIENFNRVFRLSKGDYFMWASGHDLRTPGSIAKCVEVMQRDSNVVLCYPEIAHIDTHGEVIGVRSDFHTTFHMPSDKIGRLMFFAFSMCPPDIIYGLLRRSAAQDIARFQPVFGSDYLILIRLCLAGSFAQVRGEFLYTRRERGDEAFPEDHLKRYKRAWFSDATRPRRWFPFWGLFRECLALASCERSPLYRKAILYLCLLMWLGRYCPCLLRELLAGGV